MPTARMLFIGMAAIGLATVPLRSAPPAPTNLTATAGDKRVTLAWTAAAGATSYSVYRGTTSGGQLSVPIASGLTVTTYVDTAVLNGVPYYYKVAAADASGLSPRSNEVVATPKVPITPPVEVSPADQALWRLLRQSTWGPTKQEFDALKQMGMNAWLDQQLAAPAAIYPPSLIDQSMEITEEYFFKLALLGNGQLRQRVAWALSQIWVVSTVQLVRADAMVPYIRITQDRALGNYLDLMKEMTLNPAMGEYLDMVNNKKASGDFKPNENYARELLQLFTLGLTELNPDGTPKVDAANQPVPTYGQNDVLELARVFTGWTYPDTNPGPPTQANPPRYDRPMEAIASLHDTGAKRFLKTDVPAGLSAAEDVDNALRIIFQHPNMGPFIGRQLILRLVGSNPSPTYVRDVAAVFANNGQNVRGDLKAVVKAILMHPEAQLVTSTSSKLSEPALFITRQIRPIGGNITDYPFMSDLTKEMGQQIFAAPSVFSYFSPTYKIPGTSLTGPEFQLYNTATAMVRANFVARLVSGGFGEAVKLRTGPWLAVATDAGALLNKVNVELMGGRMSADMRASMLTAIQATTNTEERVMTAFYLTFTSSQFQIEQ